MIAILMTSGINRSIFIRNMNILPWIRESCSMEQKKCRSKERHFYYFLSRP